jgi:hypothetical protein
MPQHFSQISLVAAIFKELDRQGLEQDPPIEATVSVRQLNLIAVAATSICEALARDDKLSTPNMGLQQWFATDDTGVSSLTMAAVMFKAGNYVGTPGRWSHPRDPDDFGRCHRLLEAVPGSRERLHLMKPVSPIWSRLVDQWDTITALYLEELPARKAPKCYALIQSITNPT